MDTSSRPGRVARVCATVGCLGVAVAICGSVAVAPAGAAGLADRIVSAQHSRSGTVYWSFKRDGSDRRKVLSVPGGSEVLHRSADGRHVVVLASRDGGNGDLHLARVDGRRRRVLAPAFAPTPSGPEDPDGIALSPDG